MPHPRPGLPEPRVCAELRQCHAGFVQALKDELREVDARRRKDSFEVDEGEGLGAPYGRWQYRFQLVTAPGRIRAGQEVGYEANGSLLRAVVEERTDDSVVVGVYIDLGPRAPSGRLLVDSSWLLGALMLRVEGLDCRLAAGGDSGFNFHAAARALGLTDLSSVVPPREPGKGSLNQDQEHAVARCRVASSTYVWGPPGTGKTHTLIEALVAVARDGQRALLLAPTNQAVDLLLERGDPAFQREAWWRDGAVIRVGPPDSLTLSDSLSGTYYFDYLLRRWGVEDRGSPQAERLLRSASVVATTVHQTYLSRQLMDLSWDVVVVDEASMVNPITLFVAAGLGERTVIAGDFRQLPPVSLSRTPAARAWLAQDPFAVVGIPQDLERGDFPDYLVMLRTQYRMAPGLTKLVSSAYGDSLFDSASVLARPQGLLGRSSLFYVDSGRLPSHVEITRRGSRRNPTHAVLVSKLLARLLHPNRLAPTDLRQVLCATPFVDQAHLLTTVLRKRFGASSPSVRTVHRCQGEEADVVLLDLVDSRSAPLSRFLSAEDFAQEGGRLLTVALTRARQHLVVVADMDHLAHSTRAGSVAQGLVRDLRRLGREIPIEWVMKAEMAV